jgi:hypothetical protein
MSCCDGECNQGRNCPHRGESMSGTNQWMLGMVVGVVLTSLIALGLNKLHKAQSPQSYVEMPKDIIQAYNMGLKDALKTNPASWDLEQTCLNLWADKQPVR